MASHALQVLDQVGSRTVTQAGRASGRTGGGRLIQSRLLCSAGVGGVAASPWEGRDSWRFSGSDMGRPKTTTVDEPPPPSSSPSCDDCAIWSARVHVQISAGSLPIG